MPAPIYHNGLAYRLVKNIVAFGVQAYFGHIVVKGRENLPDTPCILAPNHQNAFLDALLMLQLYKRKPTVFVARADIFGNTLAHKVLQFLKIMPVYRARDGRNNLDKNGAIFEKSIQTLLHNVPFCIMAEGTHNNRRQLLPLKKGIFRIAFATKAQMAETPLYIVPVGIDYANYSSPGHTAIINIGKPIAIEQYMESFSENNAVTVNILKNDLRNAMLEQMHNIQTTNHYDEFYLLSALYARQKCPLYGKNNDWQRFELRRRASQKLDLIEQRNPQKASQIALKTKEITAFCQSNGVDISHLFATDKKRSVAVCIVLIALAAVALALTKWQLLAALLLLCPTPFLPTQLLLGKQSDPQFVGSLNFAVQFLLTTTYLSAMTALVWIFGKWYLALAALAAGCAAWRMGYKIAAWVKSVVADCKIWGSKRKAAEEARKDIMAIFSEME